jgi:chorismate mutase
VIRKGDRRGPGRWLAVGALLVLTPLACQAPVVLTEQESAAVDRTLDLVNKRLALMPAVAKAKWNDKREIADPQREAKLLDAVAARAQEKGWDGDVCRAFVAAQIEAAKLVQEDHFTRWRNEGQGRFEGAATLAELRKDIEAVTAELLDAAEELRPLLARPRVRSAVGRRAEIALGGVSAEARAAALKPLLRK